MTFTDTPDTYLADFGVTVVAGMVSGVGLLDMPDSVIGGMSISTDYEVTCKTSVFGTVANGSSITVDGVGYTVKEVRKVGDGVFCAISLKKT